MPERSFGRTVRYRRTKLGLSQAKLGELVGRSTATIRSWERDKSRPTDPKVLAALAAILGVNEKHLFEKADVEAPLLEETSPTVEQALATLQPAEPELQEEEIPEPESAVEETAPERRLVSVPAAPSYSAPPEPFARQPVTPAPEVSYMEDKSQRQMYRVRNLATFVAVVALTVAFIWALGEGWGALGDWWDDFFGNLRL